MKRLSICISLDDIRSQALVDFETFIALRPDVCTGSPADHVLDLHSRDFLDDWPVYARRLSARLANIRRISMYPDRYYFEIEVPEDIFDGVEFQLDSLAKAYMVKSLLASWCSRFFPSLQDKWEQAADEILGMIEAVIDHMERGLAGPRKFSKFP